MGPFLLHLLPVPTANSGMEIFLFHLQDCEGYSPKILLFSMLVVPSRRLKDHLRTLVFGYSESVANSLFITLGLSPRLASGNFLTMAARAILRRRILLDHLNGPNGSIHAFSSFGNGKLDDKFDLRVSTQVANGPSRKAEAAKVDVARLSAGERSFGLSILEYSRCNPSRISTGDCRYERPEIAFPMGSRWISVSQLHAASVAKSGQPETCYGDKSKEVRTTPLKEASPKECDQAVEGLSSVKAKVKVKQLQQSQTYAVSILKGFWFRLLRIGPALRAVASMSREDWAKKLHHWKDEFFSTVQHYWLGLKLLWANIRISTRLLFKLARGKSLSRRERQQLTLTTADIFRLFPLAVIIIVPFMDFLLPVLLKVFPNMLPSTFQDKMKEEETLKKRINARLEYAKFLQETAKEMAKEVQSSCGGETKKTAKDLEEFLSKVRTGAYVSNEEILGFAKLFNDELTLDNISRPRLVSMCKYMGINTYGSDAHLRYLLRKKLAAIKDDDKMIHAEGVESLSEAELRQACRDRGMLGIRPVEDMRQMLHDWLDLSLVNSVPSSLLILSRAFIVSGIRPEEAVQATLSSLPDEVVDTAGVTALPSEDSMSERRRKLELLKMQEELIKDEEKWEEEAQIKDGKINEEDLALKEITLSTAREAEEMRKVNILEKEEKLSNLRCAVAVLASASSVSREREEFVRLVNKEIEFYKNVVDKEGTEGVEEARKAFRAAREERDHVAEAAISNRVSEALINKVDGILQKLEKEIDVVDATIGDRWRLLDRDNDGKVSLEEVAVAAKYLKDAIGEEGVRELMSNLLKDNEGKILVEDIVNLELEEKIRKK
ncbi:uncharacterized protein [Aristolochia californica]|uniref:uncharacterized protein isoform X2 n=1 Tax=Aristolochia californica TaxID=171875 RepID=UPI0035D9EEE5